MRNLGYGNPGSSQDRKVFKVNLELKSKSELLLIIGNIVDACDNEAKGYVSQWEATIRHIIGYERGNGIEHADKCGCDRCRKEHVGAYRRAESSQPTSGDKPGGTK